MLGYGFADYLLVTLPDAPSNHETVIADAQGLVRRDAVVCRGVTPSEVELIARDATLIRERRAFVDFPAEAD